MHEKAPKRPIEEVKEDAEMNEEGSITENGKEEQPQTLLNGGVGNANTTN